jgi:hypothetical protein
MLILFVLMTNIYIYKPNKIGIFFINENVIQYQLNTNQEEWTDVGNKFYFRTKTAQYLQDEKRIHILMMNNQDFYLNFDFLFKIELFYRNKTKKLIQLDNILFNAFLRDVIYEDLELTASLDINEHVTLKEISDLEMILEILIFKKKQHNFIRRYSTS